MKYNNSHKTIRDCNTKTDRDSDRHESDPFALTVRIFMTDDQELDNLPKTSKKPASKVDQLQPKIDNKIHKSNQSYFLGLRQFMWHKECNI